MALIQRHIAVSVFKVYALMAIGLTAMFTLLDFVEQLASVGQGHYGVLAALAYVLLTAPNRLLQVTPVSLLLASLLALGNMNRTLELTAARCLGLSEARIIASVVMLAVPVGLVLLMLAEFAIPPAERLAQELRTTAIASPTAANNFWAHAPGQYLSIGGFRRGNAYDDIDLFDFDQEGDQGSPGGDLQRFVHADHAVVQPDGSWLLTDVVIKQVDEALLHTHRLASLSWPPFITAPEVRLLRLPLESMPPLELYRYVHRLRRRHEPDGRLERALWDRLVLPVSMIAMILIAAPFVFAQTRAHNSGTQIVLGAAIGIVFTLCQQIVPHAGTLLDLGPMAGALASPVLLAGLAAYLFRRVI